MIPSMKAEIFTINRRLYLATTLLSKIVNKIVPAPTKLPAIPTDMGLINIKNINNGQRIFSANEPKESIIIDIKWLRCSLKNIEKSLKEKFIWGRISFALANITMGIIKIIIAIINRDSKPKKIVISPPKSGAIIDEKLFRESRMPT